MSATIGIKKLKVEKTGVIANVPNNDLAKLMYYLGCVFSVIEFDKNNKLSDYKNYCNLSEEEKKLVYTLSILFDPKIFINAGVFVVKPELLSENLSNEFFKITDERIGVHVSKEIMVGGRAVKVLEIMVCKSSWLDNNYYSPLKDIIPKHENKEIMSNNNISGNTSSRNNFIPESNEITNNQNKPKEKTTPVSDILSDFTSFESPSPQKEKSSNCCKWCSILLIIICICFFSLFIIVFYITFH